MNRIKENKLKNEGLWEDGTFYNSYINEELQDFRKTAWQKQILCHLPENGRARILDIGTGPGFIPIILSEKGHMVTGIDSSGGMLKAAEENAGKISRNSENRPEFLYMDVNDLKFPDHTFDLITGRNVIWFLDDPNHVYRELFRVLKPCGKLLIYDANWHMHFYDDELMKKVRSHEREHYEKFGEKMVVCVDDEAYYITKPLSNVKRPEWDVQALHECGFRKVEITEDIGKSVYQEWEQKLYQESPLFEVCAIK